MLYKALTFSLSPSINSTKSLVTFENWYEMMSQSDYHQALLNKLVEEAKEAAEAKPNNLVEELADVYEVIDAILTNLEIDKDTVLTKQGQKRQNKGGFTKKLRLLWTE